MANLLTLTIALVGSCFLYASCHGSQNLASNGNREVAGVSQEDHPIKGRWGVDSLTLPTVTIPSFCNEIGEGAVFEFEGQGNLMIYPKGVTKACGVYKYRIDESSIQVIKDDMIMLVAYKCSEDNLTLSSKTFFRWKDEDVQDTVVSQALLQEGVSVYLSRF